MSDPKGQLTIFLEKIESSKSDEVFVDGEGLTAEGKETIKEEFTKRLGSNLQEIIAYAGTVLREGMTVVISGGSVRVTLSK